MEPEERERESEEQKKLDEEERAEIEAAQDKWNALVISRMKLMRRLGQPCEMFRREWTIDARLLFNRGSNCDKIDCGDGPVDPEILLERERAFWSIAMEYRRAQNMDAEYDLIPSNMTLSPIMSESGFWYHGNLVGSKRESPSKGVQQCFFLELNRTRQKTYDVTACIALDDYDVDTTCKRCSSHSGVLHPRRGGFTFGSKEGPSKEDLGATPASISDRVVPSPAPLPTLGNETLEPIIRRLSTMVGGGTSKPVAAAAAATAIGTHPKSKSLTTTPSGSSRLITKRQLEVALASALAGGGTCSSEDNNQ
ncbi:hypothetical protein ACQJBY_047650 [Aegilops geniculata]